MSQRFAGAGSPDFLRLVRLPARARHAVMRRGIAPDPVALAGWEYRGVNMPGVFALAGIRRFIKGFRALEDGRVQGYNVAVAGSALQTAWKERLQPDGGREFAAFRLVPVEPASPDNRYPGALLLDYGTLPHPELGMAGALADRLRDYVVRVRRGSDDLLLGRAYLRFGRLSVPVGWFALERMTVATSPGRPAV